MTGWSEARDCLYCGGKRRLEAQGEGNNVSGTCLVCGYSYHTVEEQLTLDEVNEERKVYGMIRLIKLKPNTFKERKE